MEDFDQLFDDDLFKVNKNKDTTVKLKEGERRMVSILFADIKGFTALSEVLDHEEVRNLVDKLLKIFSRCVEIHGGYVDKYTGDQIMALFGAKKASEVDTQRSINTALLMLEKLKKFNSILRKTERYKDLGIDFSIRIGVNTGMVTTGAVGKEREGDYTVYGDAVNLASRMESNAPLNSIMIPEETMLLVKDDFIFKDNSSINVKGKSQPISVFLVQSLKDKLINNKSLFIGREDEIKVLKKIYNSIKLNIKKNEFSKINFIGVTAEAGIGKTRLLHEYLKSDKGISFTLSHASNISSKPYFLFISLIKDIFKISEIDSMEITKNKFEDAIKRLIEKNIELKEQIEASIPFLGFLIGINYNDDRLKDRDEIHNHIGLALKTLIKSISTESNKKGLPYVIIFDDMHWIDKMSLDMLEYLINTLNVENARNGDAFSQILLMGTYRTEFSFEEKLHNELHFKEIHLLPLSKEDSIRLIKNSTSQIKLKDNVILELIDKSKGNPFFIEEWISLIKEQKKSSSAINNSREIKNIYEIPKSINSLILARIDNLEKTLKLILQKATIIGEDFFVQILSQLENKLGIDNNIDKTINNLKNEDFIYNYINQSDHYKFKHLLTRDVAYSTILISNKKILHKAVAEIIEEYFSDKLETFYFDLAIHYDISENYDSALEYLYLAGNKHSNLFDFGRALQCYERILKIIESQKKYTELLNNRDESKDIYHYYLNSKIKIAEISLNKGQWDKALEIHKELLDYKIKCVETNYKIFRDLGQYYSYKHDYKNAKKYLSKSFEIAKKLSKPEYIAPILGKIGLCEYDIGKFDQALEKFNQELEIFKTIQDNIGVALSEGHIGMVLFQKGKLNEAFNQFEQQYKLSKKNDSKKMILQSLGNMALIYNIRGDYDKSLNIYKEVIAIAEDTYDQRSLGQTYGNLGIIYKNLMNYKNSESNFKKQLKIALKIGDKFQESNSYDGIASVYHKINKFKDSIEFHLKAIAIEKEINDKNGLASSYCNLSLTFFDSGQIDNAKDKLNKGISLFREIGNQRAVEIGNFEMSRFLLSENNLKSAINILKSPIDFFEKINDNIFLIKSLIQLGILQRMSKVKDSSDTFNKALKIATKIKHQDFINTIKSELKISSKK